MNLLPRAKSFHDLTLILCALLAWPANLPIVSREVARVDLVARSSHVRQVGRCFEGPERKPHPCNADWAVDADNLESSDGRDDFRLAPLAIPHRGLDLPSLVPSSLESRPLGPVDSVGSIHRHHPLRC